MNNRVVNIKFAVDGFKFDAAIDCEWSLHDYDWIEKSDKIVPVELYCYNHPEWDIYMLYLSGHNDQSSVNGFLIHTIVDINDIIEGARKWIEEQAELGEM